MDGWQCPHPTDDHSDHCPLHTPSADESTVRTLLETSSVRDENGSVPAVGARASVVPVGDAPAPLDLRDATTTIVAPPDATVPQLDLRGATLDTLDLAETTVTGRILLDDASVTEIRFVGTRVDRLVSLTGASVGTVRAVEARFGDALDTDGMQVDQDCRFTAATFDGPVGVTGAMIEDDLVVDGCRARDDVGLGDTTIGGSLTARDAQFDRRFTADGIDVEGITTFHTTTIGGVATFDDARFRGEVRFNAVTFASAARFVATEFHRRVRFSRADFRGELECSRTRFGDVASFDRATFVVSANFGERATFENTAVFSDAEATGSISFDTATAETVDLSGLETTADVSFRSAVVSQLTVTNASLSTLTCPSLKCAGRFNGDKLHTDADVRLADATVAGDMTLRDAHIDGRIIARGTTFDGEVDCREATVTGGLLVEPSGDTPTRITGAVSLADARLGRLILDHAVLPQTVFADRMVVETVEIRPANEANPECITFQNATLEAGALGQPTDYSLAYDLREAHLGEVSLAASSADDTPLAPYWIMNASFDGFEFDAHRDLLTASGWRLHGTPEETTPTPSELETTYMAAKNGATNVSDQTAASQFFQRELRHRRRRYLNVENVSTRELLGWLSNLTLELTTGYGEKPSRTLYASVILVIGFAAAYVLLPPSSVTPEAVSEQLLFSLQSFTSFVFGPPPVPPSLTVKLLTAFEGFLGAFLIGLFVFALTRSVHR